MENTEVRCFLYSLLQTFKKWVSSWPLELQVKSLTGCSWALEQERNKAVGHQMNFCLQINWLIYLLSSIRNMQIMKDRKRTGNQAFKIAFKYFFSPNCAREEKRKRGGGLHKSKLRNYCSLMTLNKLFRLTWELEFCSSS